MLQVNKSHVSLPPLTGAWRVAGGRGGTAVKADSEVTSERSHGTRDRQDPARVANIKKELKAFYGRMGPAEEILREKKEAVIANANKRFSRLGFIQEPLQKSTVAIRNPFTSRTLKLNRLKQQCTFDIPFLRSAGWILPTKGEIGNTMKTEAISSSGKLQLKSVVSEKAENQKSDNRRVKKPIIPKLTIPVEPVPPPKRRHPSSAVRIMHSKRNIINKMIDSDYRRQSIIEERVARTRRMSSAYKSKQNSDDEADDDEEDDATAVLKKVHILRKNERLKSIRKIENMTQCEKKRRESVTQQSLLFKDASDRKLSRRPSDDSKDSSSTASTVDSELYDQIEKRSFHKHRESRISVGCSNTKSVGFRPSLSSTGEKSTGQTTTTRRSSSVSSSTMYSSVVKHIYKR